MIALFGQSWPAETRIEVAGAPVVVTVRVSVRARSYRLSLPHRGGPVLTVPKHGRWHEAETFLLRQRPWLAARLQRSPSPKSLASLTSLPVRGVVHRIVATQTARGRVTPSDLAGELALLVPGTEPGQRARRLFAWLKAEAQADLEARVAIHARRLGAEALSVTLRSQSTRWGSCSSSGRLNFNWRLILAPGFVLDYVAAHEVAHLVEMNHSPAFWAAVEKTLPDMARGRSWLKAHGRELMTYSED